MADQYISSVFNYIVRDLDKIILFNSYTGQVAYSHDCNDVELLLKGEHCEKEALKERMVEKGFLVPSKENEWSKGMLKYYDRIYDKTLTLTFLTTEQCNFRCKYCYEIFEKGKMSEEVITGVLRYLEKNLYAYSGLNISWFGGEPLLALDVIETFSEKAIMMCKQARKPYLAGMTTNGYLLTPEVFERLLKQRVYHYQITIDGIESDHDKNRVLKNGAPTYATILENLKGISRTVKSKLFTITIRVNVTKESIEHLEEFLDIMNREFGNDKRFDIFVRPVGDWGGERVKEIKENLCEKENKIFSILLNYQRNSRLQLNSYENLLNSGVCYAARRNNFIIGSDGIIYKCTLHFDREFNRVGRVLKNGTFNIDKGKLARWVTPTTLPRKCVSCFNVNNCPGGQCAAQRMIEDENLNVNCGYEVNDLDNVLQIICMDGKERQILGNC